MNFVPIITSDGGGGGGASGGPTPDADGFVYDAGRVITGLWVWWDTRGGTIYYAQQLSEETVNPANEADGVQVIRAVIAQSSADLQGESLSPIGQNMVTVPTASQNAWAALPAGHSKYWFRTHADGPGVVAGVLSFPEPPAPTDVEGWVRYLLDHPHARRPAALAAAQAPPLWRARWWGHWGRKGLFKARKPDGGGCHD